MSVQQSFIFVTQFSVKNTIKSYFLSGLRDPTGRTVLVFDSSAWIPRPVRRGRRGVRDFGGAQFVGRSAGHHDGGVSELHDAVHLLRGRDLRGAGEARY